MLETLTWTFNRHLLSVVCLCDLDEGLKQLSDLQTLQLGFGSSRREEQRGEGGDNGVSHGVLVGGCQGYIRGGICFPSSVSTKHSPLSFSFPEGNIQIAKLTVVLWCYFTGVFFKYRKRYTQLIHLCSQLMQCDSNTCCLAEVKGELHLTAVV